MFNFNNYKGNYFMHCKTVENGVTVKNIYPISNTTLTT